MININYRDPRPIYEQVKDNFRQLIISGALPPDEKMPSVREELLSRFDALVGELALVGVGSDKLIQRLEAEK